jgi:hypothetical protein
MDLGGGGRGRVGACESGGAGGNGRGKPAGAGTLVRGSALERLELPRGSDKDAMMQWHVRHDNRRPG